MRGSRHHPSPPGGRHAPATAAHRERSDVLDPRAPQLGPLGEGRPERGDQPRHAGQARSRGAAREERPQRLAEPAVPEGAGAEQHAARAALHADGHARPYSRPFGPVATLQRPGLHVSCLPFLRDHDVSVLVWDMLDHLPIGYDIPWAVHAAIFAYGVALLDNALLEPLAKACVEEGRDEFMLVISPLAVLGGTGSPANPLAVF